MPPKRRNTRQKAVKQLTEEEQLKRDQCDLLIKDLEKNMETIINEARREKDALISNAITMYKLEMMKLPTDVKNMKWDDYFNKSVDQDNNILNVSNVVDNCLDDTVCVKVDQQMDMLKSAMKTAKKKGRPKKENDPGTVRKSSRSKSADQTVGGDTVTRTSSRSRTRGLTDASNLQTPAQGRSRRGMAVPETPANSGPPSYVGMTPMVTPKFDTTNLSRTVTRVARNDEVLMSLSGSPVAPSGPRSKVCFPTKFYRFLCFTFTLVYWLIFSYLNALKFYKIFNVILFLKFILYFLF